MFNFKKKKIGPRDFNDIVKMTTVITEFKLIINFTQT